MLESAVIRASSSPFPTPFLLVKKKKEHQGFVGLQESKLINYRDIISITWIKQLLDRLYGVSYISLSWIHRQGQNITK